jgi:carbon storage regulator
MEGAVRSARQKEPPCCDPYRRVGETIIIELPSGEQVRVSVLGTKGNQVRIGTDAPEQVPIIREELLEPEMTG